MALHRTFEMTVSREEFFRLLPAAVGPFVLEGDAVRQSDGLRSSIIRLAPLADHRLGAVVVPRHRVEIVLEGYSEAEAGAFMERFHRGFLRGGG